MTTSFRLNRRVFLAGGPAAASLALVGCGSAPERAPSERASSPNSAGPITLEPITVYRDPSCGCCEAWARAAQDAGFRTTVVDRSDMPAIKRRYGVPEELSSCHTSLAGNYVIEGHVPLAEVRRLLTAKPEGVKGIGVPGMPLGSPGMEVPDGRIEPFVVMAFDAAGRVTRFQL
mgnify:CR=1 FL=1